MFPLPADAVSPPTEKNSVVGTWVGTWDHRRNHILVVEDVNDEGRARVMYAVGRDQHNSGRWFRRQARVEGSIMTFDDGGFPARYELSASGRLRGSSPTARALPFCGVRTSRSSLPHLTGTGLQLAHSSIWKPDLIEEGAPVRLGAVLYFPQGPGLFRWHSSITDQPGPARIRGLLNQVWSADCLQTS